MLSWFIFEITYYIQQRYLIISLFENLMYITDTYKFK